MDIRVCWPDVIALCEIVISVGGDGRCGAGYFNSNSYFRLGGNQVGSCCKGKEEDQMFNYTIEMMAID